MVNGMVANFALAIIDKKIEMWKTYIVAKQSNSQRIRNNLPWTRF